jgi:hypothetical protein
MKLLIMEISTFYTTQNPLRTIQVSQEQAESLATI